MLAQPVMLLGSIPIDNPFPTALIVSTAATVAFGAELVIAALWVHPRRWLYVLLAGCVALGVTLMMWSSYYALYGPTGAEPLIYPTTIRDPWYDFYRSVLLVNVAIVLLTLILVLVFGIILWRQKRS